MKSVIFSGSMKKFATEMKEWGDFLYSEGVNVYVPKDYSSDPIWQSSEEEKRAFAHKLTTEHFEKMKEFDVLFIFNKNGYSGLSTTLEIGCAYGLNKKIYAKEKDETELCRDVLFEGYFSSKEDLLKFLRSA